MEIKLKQATKKERFKNSQVLDRKYFNQNKTEYKLNTNVFWDSNVHMFNEVSKEK